MHFTRVNSGTTLNIRLVVVRVFAAAMGLSRPSLARCKAVASTLAQKSSEVAT